MRKQELYVSNDGQHHTTAQSAIARDLEFWVEQKGDEVAAPLSLDHDVALAMVENWSEVITILQQVRERPVTIINHRASNSTTKRGARGVDDEKQVERARGGR
jgi:hypothetical protein